MFLSWLPLAVFAYLMFAVSGVIDKIIVGKKITSPAIVSFYVAAFGLFSVSILIPGFLNLPFSETFAFSLPSPAMTALILFAGILLPIGLYFMYQALQKDEATRVVSVIGAANPVFTLVLAYFLLGESLKPIYYLAFALLLAGAILISLHRKKLFGPSFVLALSSAGVLALQSVLTKMVYNVHPFVSSYALLSIGGGLYALILALLVPKVRNEVKNMLGIGKKKNPKLKPTKKTPIHWVMVNSAIGGVGVLALNISLSLGPASLVNALRGVQYAGVFLLAIVMSKLLPKLMKEELSVHTIEQKMAAIGLIGVGIGLLVVG